MLLSKLLRIHNGFGRLERAEQLALLDSAYEIVKDYIRLQRCVLPVYIDKQVVNIYEGLDVYGSEIRLKEIKSFIGVDIENIEISNLPTGNALFGKIEFNDYLFTEFDNVNLSHSIKPIIRRTENLVEISNLEELEDKCLVLLTGFQYPYPVRPLDEKIDSIFEYSLSKMTTRYGIDNLIIDDSLAILMALKAIQIMYEQNGQIGQAKHFDYFFVQYVNIHNEWNETVHNERTTGITEVTLEHHR
jgi:hypothetical protein